MFLLHIYSALFFSLSFPYLLMYCLSLILTHVCLFIYLFYFCTHTVCISVIYIIIPLKKERKKI